jgi:integrase
MAGQNWIKAGKGVRYYEHETRKHGLKNDRYFSIRYKVDGKTIEEGAGWASEGMTLEKAAALRVELQQNKRAGTGPQTLGERREQNRAAEEAKAAALKASSKELTTFREFWETEYWPQAQHSLSRKSVETSSGYYRRWLEPALGRIALSKITPAQIDSLVFAMTRAGRKSGTVAKVLGVFSTVWTRAKLLDYVSGDCPVQRVKKPSQDGRRVRFLEVHEANALLAGLRKHSLDTHDAAVLALFAGLRAGEIHKLTWSDVDIANRLLTIKDAKNGKTRYAHVTREIQDVLERRMNGQDKTALVFPPRAGAVVKDRISKTFGRIVDELGLNDGVSDYRNKVCFHTLRHTFASWLVRNGEPLFTVATLLGHSSIAMTMRYAHLAPDTTRLAITRLEGMLEPKPAKIRQFNG